MLEEAFAAPGGGYYSARAGDPTLIARPQEIYDGAIPSGMAVATMNNLKLHTLTFEASYREAAERALTAAGEILERQPFIAPTLLCALDWVLGRPWEVAVVCPDPPEGPLVRAVHEVFAPNAVRAVVQSGAHQEEVAERVPWAGGRPARGGPTAYLCVEGACRAPETDPAIVRRLLREGPSA